MPTPMSSWVKAESIGFLELRIHEIEAQDPLDIIYWKSLMMQLAATTATGPAGVAAKLRIVRAGIEFDADEIDLKILESAIIDLERLLETM